MKKRLNGSSWPLEIDFPEHVHIVIGRDLLDVVGIDLVLPPPGIRLPLQDVVGEVPFGAGVQRKQRLHHRVACLVRDAADDEGEPPVDGGVGGGVVPGVARKRQKRLHPPRSAARQRAEPRHLRLVLGHFAEDRLHGVVDLEQPSAIVENSPMRDHVGHAKISCETWGAHGLASPASRGG